MTASADTTIVNDPMARAEELALRLAAALDAGDDPAHLRDVSQELADAVLAAEEVHQAEVDPTTDRYLLRGAAEIASAAAALDATSLRLGVETVRQAIDRFRDYEAVADTRPLAEIITWLMETTHANIPRLADILGVRDSTVRRWHTERRDRGAAETEDMGRVRVLAQVVRQLSHVLTGGGVVSWLESRNPAFKGLPPKALLGEPGRLFELVGAASHGRSQAAS